MNFLSIVKLRTSWESEAETLALSSLFLTCSWLGQMELV